MGKKGGKDVSLGEETWLGTTRERTFHRVGGSLVRNAIVRRAQGVQTLEGSGDSNGPAEVGADAEHAALQSDEGAFAAGRAAARERTLTEGRVSFRLGRESERETHVERVEGRAEDIVDGLPEHKGLGNVRATVDYSLFRVVSLELSNTCIEEGEKLTPCLRSRSTRTEFFLLMLPIHPTKPAKEPVSLQSFLLFTLGLTHSELHILHVYLVLETDRNWKGRSAGAAKSRRRPGRAGKWGLRTSTVNASGSKYCEAVTGRLFWRRDGVLKWPDRLSGLSEMRVELLGSFHRTVDENLGQAVDLNRNQ